MTKRKPHDLLPYDDVKAIVGNVKLPKCEKPTIATHGFEVKRKPRQMVTVTIIPPDAITEPARAFNTLEEIEMLSKVLEEQVPPGAKTFPMFDNEGRYVGTKFMPKTRRVKREERKR